MEKLLAPLSTQSPGKARGTPSPAYSSVLAGHRYGLGSRNKAVHSRLAVLVPRIILV